MVCKTCNKLTDIIDKQEDALGALCNALDGALKICEVKNPNLRAVVDAADAAGDIYEDAHNNKTTIFNQIHKELFTH